MPRVNGLSLGASALAFWYPVCHQLNQQHERFCIDFFGKHLKSNRCFDSFLGKLSAITKNLDKILKREKNFILDF